MVTASQQGPLIISQSHISHTPLTTFISQVLNKRKEVCKPLNQQDPLVEITAGSVLMINLASLTSQHEAVTVSHCTDVICLFSVPNLFSITEDDMIVQVH